MGNPYGIALNRAWTEWATECALSETTAVALYLLSENRKADEVVAKLKPAEVKLVVGVVQRWPESLPPRALAAIEAARPAPAPEPSGRSDRATHARRHTRPSASTRSATEHSADIGAQNGGTLSGTRPGTRAETARRHIVVEDLNRAGLSIRTIAAGTGIPRSSVHRAVRAIAKAQAKREIAVVRIAQELLDKSLPRRSRGRP
jgi:hypothetical protein